MACIYKSKKRLLLSVLERLWRQADEGKRWVRSSKEGARGDPEMQGLLIDALELGAVY